MKEKDELKKIMLQKGKLILRIWKILRLFIRQQAKKLYSEKNIKSITTSLDKTVHCIIRAKALSFQTEGDGDRTK